MEPDHSPSYRIIIPSNSSCLLTTNLQVCPKVTANIMCKRSLIHYLKSTEASTPLNLKQTQQQQSHQQSPVSTPDPLLPSEEYNELFS